MRAILYSLPALLVTLAAASCSPHACSEEEDYQLEGAVEVLIGEPGPVADDAERFLVARGREAIVHLETGLYTADPAARRRVVRALVRIGEPEAMPILEHLIRRDPDEEVRAAARRGIDALTAPR